MKSELQITQQDPITMWVLWIFGLFCQIRYYFIFILLYFFKNHFFFDSSLSLLTNNSRMRFFSLMIWKGKLASLNTNTWRTGRRKTLGVGKSDGEDVKCCHHTSYQEILPATLAHPLKALSADVTKSLGL